MLRILIFAANDPVVFMPRNLPLNLNVQYHLLVGAAAGFWITLFLVVVGPFDTAPLSMTWRARVMFGYGLIFFFSYAFAIPLQNWWYSFRKRWSVEQEVCLYLFMFGSCLPVSYAYYSSTLINGDFPFSQFTLEIYFPTLLILLPLLIISRRLVNNILPGKKRPGNKNQLEATDLLNWKGRIEKLMEEGVYLDPVLSLNSMAEQLGTNSSVLSRVINQGYGANFNDFINAYRVEAVRHALEKGAHKTHTLAGIAQDCGFSSKATFNRAFKKHLELSPSEYIRQLEDGGMRR
jgi:AraC-like DNA-binding protein